jgi:hypothetical protein
MGGCKTNDGSGHHPSPPSEVILVDTATIDDDLRRRFREWLWDRIEEDRAECCPIPEEFRRVAEPSGA